jgi:hypothetical protein
MADAKMGMQDVVAAGFVAAGGANFGLALPSVHAAMECWRPGPDGPTVIWRDSFSNVVVNQGRGHVINVLFGSGTASTKGAFVWLHSATTNSNHVWSDISGSRILSFGNNVPRITFATTYASGSATATCSYSFNASTQTVSGGAILFYTTDTLSTNAATGDILEYSEAHFQAGSRAVQNNDSVSISVTLSNATA